MRAPSIEVLWRARNTPLQPVVAAARGPTASALAHRLLRQTDAQLEGSRAVAGIGLLLLRCEADEPPWVDGVRYLGLDPSAPALLLPTASEPSVPAALFERALRRRHTEIFPPIAVLPSEGRLTLVSLAAGRPLSRAGLVAWLERQTDWPCTEEAT